MFDPETFDVEDLGMAAALMCAGDELAHIRRVSYTKVCFEFVDSDRLHQHLSEYLDGALSVDALAMWNQARQLKSRLRLA